MLNHAADPKIMQNFRPSFGRMLFFGIHYEDLQDALKAAQTLSDWGRIWEKRAQKYTELGDDSFSHHYTLSATEFWMSACSALHFGEFKIYDDEEYKTNLQRIMRSNYRKALPYLGYAVRRVEIPFEGVRLPGYLHLTEKTPAPCVIMLNGLDSVKEVELHKFADVFHSRGISTFCFDGPGQGELVGELPMGLDIEEVCSTVIDFIQSQPEVKGNKVGIFGVSFGGYLACRAAAVDSRITACICLGGFFDHRVTERFSPTARKALIRAFGDERRLTEMLPKLTLESFHGCMDRSLLVVHGGQDKLIPYAQIEALLQWAIGDKKLLFYEDGDHVCTNRFSECLPIVGDWLSARLESKKQINELSN